MGVDIQAVICPENLHLHGDADYDDSEDMKMRQEAAMATETERYYRRVRRLLALNLPFLDKVAAALAEKHLLTGNDIRTIREDCEILL